MYKSLRTELITEEVLRVPGYHCCDIHVSWTHCGVFCPPPSTSVQYHPVLFAAQLSLHISFKQPPCKSTLMHFLYKIQKEVLNPIYVFFSQMAHKTVTFIFHY